MFVPGSSLWPNIKIWGKDSNGNYRTTDDIFSTTIHELGHASHIELMNAGLIQFGQVSVQIRESWANAIEWYITKIEYNELGFPNYDNPYMNYFMGDHMQWWKKAKLRSDYNLLTDTQKKIINNYTPLFIDLVDDYNQSVNIGSTNYPDDAIHAYTMPRIENLLKHVYGLSSLQSKLKANKPYGVTDNQIDRYLNYYFSL